MFGENSSPPASHTNHVVQLLLTCHEDFEVKTGIGGFCGGTTTSINTEPWIVTSDSTRHTNSIGPITAQYQTETMRRVTECLF